MPVAPETWTRPCAFEFAIHTPLVYAISIGTCARLCFRSISCSASSRHFLMSQTSTAVRPRLLPAEEAMWATNELWHTSCLLHR